MYPCLSLGSLKLPAPHAQYFGTVKSFGIKYLDLPIRPETDLSVLKCELARHDLRIASQFLPAKPWRAGEDEWNAWRCGEGRWIVEQSVELGCRRFGAYIEPGSDSLSYRENFSWHANRLRELAGLLEEFGATLSLEYIAPKTSRERFRYPFIWNLQQTLELCEATASNVGVVLDSWHWHASLGTPRDIASIPAGRIGIVHINDAPDGVPVEQLMDLERRLPVATGVIDMGAFMQELSKKGYDGPVIPEPFDASLEGLESQGVIKRAADSIAAAFKVAPHSRVPDEMQVLVMGNNKTGTVTLPVPRPVGNQVVVKLHATMICGSNLLNFLGQEEKINGGHEGAGEVVAVAHSTRLKVGARVALAPLTSCGHCSHCLRGETIFCDHRPAYPGTFAQYALVSDSVCIPLPDDVDYEKGSLLGCGLGPAYAALKALNIRAFDKLLITGLGPVGLGATALATYLNADVAVVDPEPYRRDIASRLGAQCVLDPTHEGYREQLSDFFGASGVHRAIECSGNAQVERQVLDVAGKGAHIAFIGENKGTIEVSPSNDFLRKGLKVCGIWHMNMNDTDDLIEFLRRAGEKADLLITHRYSMRDCQQAFEAFASRQAVKVVIRPND